MLPSREIDAHDERENTLSFHENVPTEYPGRVLGEPLQAGEIVEFVHRRWPMDGQLKESASPALVLEEGERGLLIIRLHPAYRKSPLCGFADIVSRADSGLIPYVNDLGKSHWNRQNYTRRTGEQINTRMSVREAGMILNLFGNIEAAQDKYGIAPVESTLQTAALEALARYVSNGKALSATSVNSKLF